MDCLEAAGYAMVIRPREIVWERFGMVKSRWVGIAYGFVRRGRVGYKDDQGSVWKVGKRWVCV